MEEKTVIVIRNGVIHGYFYKRAIAEDQSRKLRTSYRSGVRWWMWIHFKHPSYVVYQV
jgi:hypothetical protein